MSKTANDYVKEYEHRLGRAVKAVPILTELFSQALAQQPPESDPDRVKAEPSANGVMVRLDSGKHPGWYAVASCGAAVFEQFRDECREEGRRKGLGDALQAVRVTVREQNAKHKIWVGSPERDRQCDLLDAIEELLFDAIGELES